MYTVRRDARGFVEVKESLLSFTDTEVTFWYYDTDNWLRTVLGKEGEVPIQPMTEQEIDWATKYYLPKI